MIKYRRFNETHDSESIKDFFNKLSETNSEIIFYHENPMMGGKFQITVVTKTETIKSKGGTPDNSSDKVESLSYPLTCLHMTDEEFVELGKKLAKGKGRISSVPPNIPVVSNEELKDTRNTVNSKDELKDDRNIAMANEMFDKLRKLAEDNKKSPKFDTGIF